MHTRREGYASTDAVRPAGPSRSARSIAFIVAACALVALVAAAAPAAAQSSGNSTAPGVPTSLEHGPLHSEGAPADGAGQDPVGFLLSTYAWLTHFGTNAVPFDDEDGYGFEVPPVLDALGLTEPVASDGLLDAGDDPSLAVQESAGQGAVLNHGVRPGADGPQGGPAAATTSSSVPAVAYAVSIAAGVGLVALPAMSLYRRVKKSKALNNDVRRAVYRFVENNPGATITEVAQGVGCSHSTATYHVQILEEFDLITKRRDGNSLHIFPADAGLGRKEALLLSYMRDQETREIIRSVHSNPWTYPSELARALNMSRSSAQWHLDKLEDCGIVQVARDGKFSYLYIDPDMKEKVEQYLVPQQTG